MGKSNTKRDLPVRQNAGRQMSKDWTPFAQNLAQVLGLLKEDQFLILSSKHGNRFLQFSIQGAWGLRAEVASNYFLKGDDRLSHQEMAWVCAHGWNPPSGTPTQATPENDPDGSPNYYIDFPASVSASDIAKLVIDTLAEGLALPYPGALTYESFDSIRGQLMFPNLGLKETVRQDVTLMERVLSVFREVTGIQDSALLDEDGDVVVRYGEILIRASLLNDRVRLYSELLSQVAETPDLLHKLNQINDGVHQIRFFWHENSVYASRDIPGGPFVPAHLVAALQEFSVVTEDLAIVLRTEFPGATRIESDATVNYLQ